VSSLSSSNRRNLQFGAVVLVSIILIASGTTLAPLVSEIVLSSFYYPFAQLRTAIEQIGETAALNNELHQQIAQERLRVSLFAEAQAENERLRSVLGFEPPAGYSLLPAEIVSILGNRQPTAAVINLGIDSGIYVDQNVINQLGLIGRVVEVSDSYATVQLLTDPINRVAARVVDGRQMGIVQFLPAKGLVLNHVPSDGSVKVGDRVISSGLGRVYREGIDIGTVTHVERLEDEPFCEIILQPAADFGCIEELFLLRPVKKR
jgi:rod shape-determining protein MreC